MSSPLPPHLSHIAYQSLFIKFLVWGLNDPHTRGSEEGDQWPEEGEDSGGPLPRPQYKEPQSLWASLPFILIIISRQQTVSFLPVPWNLVPSSSLFLRNTSPKRSACNRCGNIFRGTPNLIPKVDHFWHPVFYTTKLFSASPCKNQ